jgi:ribosomal protein L23
MCEFSKTRELLLAPFVLAINLITIHLSFASKKHLRFVASVFKNTIGGRERMKPLTLLLAGIVVCLFTVQDAFAHKFLKEALEKRYEEHNIKVKSCNACHAEKKPKTERNDFGKLITENAAFKGKEYSAKLKVLHDAEDKAGEEKLEAEMLESFKKAMDDIEKMSPEKDGPTYKELIAEKKLDNIVEKEEDDE